MRETIPRLPQLDSTLGLKREGYTFISRRARQFHSDLFRGRLLARPTVFMTGVEAVSLFYDEKRMQRSGALPKLVQKTLFGEGGVQTLDDAAHRHRKAMFLSLMTKENIARFLRIAEQEWRSTAENWTQQPRIIVLQEAQRVLCRAACAWSGLELTRQETDRLARECADMLNGFDTVGPRMWRGRAARVRAERWGRQVIERVRTHALTAVEGTPVSTFATHRDLSGELLTAQVASVELLNIIRPITALARWVVFAVLALHDHPTLFKELPRDEALLDAFVQEVRRFYPFTPLLGATPRSKFTWRGAQFRPGDLVILDVYGTLHDPRVWESPDEFRPGRFMDRAPTAYDLIPQGGGDFLGAHRCAGEWLSIEVLKQVVRLFSGELTYEIPAQDMSYSLRAILPAPESGVVLETVQRTDARLTAVPDVSRLRGADGRSARRMA